MKSTTAVGLALLLSACATQADLQSLENTLESDIQKNGSEIQSSRSAATADLKVLQTRIESLDTKLRELKASTAASTELQGVGTRVQSLESSFKREFPNKDLPDLSAQLRQIAKDIQDKADDLRAQIKSEEIARDKMGKQLKNQERLLRDFMRRHIPRTAYLGDTYTIRIARDSEVFREGAEANAKKSMLDNIQGSKVKALVQGCLDAEGISGTAFLFPPTLEIPLILNGQRFESEDRRTTRLLADRMEGSPFVELDWKADARGELPSDAIRLECSLWFPEPGESKLDPAQVRWTFKPDISRVDPGFAFSAHLVGTSFTVEGFATPVAATRPGER